MVSQASINFYDILHSEIQEKTNTPTVQLGDVGNNSVYTDFAQLWQQCGIASLPSNPSAGNAAQAMVVSTSNTDYVLSTRDTRYQTQTGGSFTAGDTVLYAAGADGTGQGRIALKGDNGSITLYTTINNTPGGKALGIFINPLDDSITITNSIGNGIVIDSEGVHLTLANGDAGIDLFNNDQSIQIMAKGHTQVVGGAILLGTNATVSPINAATVGPTGSAVGGVVNTAGSAAAQIGSITGPAVTTQIVSTRVFIGL